MDKVRGLFRRKSAKSQHHHDSSSSSRISHFTPGKSGMAAIPEATTSLRPTVSSGDVSALSANATSVVLGSVRRDHSDDQRIVASLDDMYFEPEFDPRKSVLDSLPSEEEMKIQLARADRGSSSLDQASDERESAMSSIANSCLSASPIALEFLESESARLKEWQSAVERTFKKRLLDNSHKFLEGINQIREVQVDLRITASRCTASRSTLASVRSSLVSDCFTVIDARQRRQRLSVLIDTIVEMSELLDCEKQLNIKLENCEFIECIELHQRITGSLTRLSGVTALDKMRQRFRGGNSMITERLEKSLKSLIESAPDLDSEMLFSILGCYYKLNEMRRMNQLLEMTICNTLQMVCTKVICVKLDYSDKFTSEKLKIDGGKGEYTRLCKSLNVNKFMECFMEICGRVFDVLHCYYRVESSLIKFRNSHDLPAQDMQSVRKSLWVKSQSLLGDLLDASEFTLKSKIKMEDLLLALHGAEVFRTIGQAFSGSDSKELERSIRGKCKQYLDHFRREFFESLKSTFDNEMWIVLPMPDGYGVHSIKELRRNPHVLLSFKTIDAAMGSSGVNSDEFGNHTSEEESEQQVSDDEDGGGVGSNSEETKMDDNDIADDKDDEPEDKDAEYTSSEEKKEHSKKKKSQSHSSSQKKKKKKMKKKSSKSSRTSLSGTARSQPQVYQKFLAGENIFDLLMKAKKESESQSSNYDPFSPRNGSESGSPSASASSSSHSSSDPSSSSALVYEPPVITSASLNLAKHMGRCLHIMECLDPVAYDAFCALRDSFRFYLYHVFVWFGVNVNNFFEESTRFRAVMDSFGDSGSGGGGGIGGSSIGSMSSHGGDDSKSTHHIGGGSSSLSSSSSSVSSSAIRKPALAAPKYPMLCETINDVNESICSRSLAPELDDLVKKKVSRSGYGIRKPSGVPSTARVLMETNPDLKLNSSENMRGVAARFVATETLQFLLSVMDKVSSRIVYHLPDEYNAEVRELLDKSKCVVKEFKTYMYRNVPLLLVNLGNDMEKSSLISQISRQNWNRREITTECNGYVNDLVSMFRSIEAVLGLHPNMPATIHHRLNSEAMIYIQEQLVRAYAKTSRCSTEGRALMSLDQSELQKALSKLKNARPMPSFDYMTSFIQAFYLDEIGLLEWAYQHPDYPDEVIKSFVRVGRAAEGLKKRSERNSFESRLLAEWRKGKKKKQELDQL